MKTLFVTRKYPPMIGGMENLSFNITTRFPGPKKVIALRGSQRHLVWFLPYVLIRVALTAWRYDRIHLGDALLSIVGFIPRVVFRRQVFMTVHGLDLTFQQPLYQWYLRAFLRADHFIAISESTAQLVRSKKRGVVSVIPIGVDENFFSLVRNPTETIVNRPRNNRTVLLTVGRLVPRKGVVWFLEHVMPRLSQALYVIVGTGPDYAAVTSVIQRLNLEDRVIVTGAVTVAQLRELYASADIFVMPNILIPGDVEGFGIVAIEASASGLPVVASKIEGITDAIHEHQNGFYVRPGNADEMVRTLQPLIDNPANRLEAGKRGREYTQKRFSWKTVIEDYVHVFTHEHRS